MLDKDIFFYVKLVSLLEMNYLEPKELFFSKIQQTISNRSMFRISLLHLMCMQQPSLLKELLE